MWVSIGGLELFVAAFLLMVALLRHFLQCSYYDTRDRHKKVVRCISNVSVAVVHLRGRPSQNKSFPSMLCK